MVPCAALWLTAANLARRETLPDAILQAV